MTDELFRDDATLLQTRALGLMAGSLFYLDSYRKQLLAERFQLARTEAEITADGLAETPIGGRRALIERVSTDQALRL